MIFSSDEQFWGARSFIGYSSSKGLLSVNQIYVASCDADFLLFDHLGCHVLKLFFLSCAEVCFYINVSIQELYAWYHVLASTT